MGTVLAILKAIPILDSWFQQLAVLYFQQRLASMKAENKEAIRKAIYEHDQRGIEVAIGSDTAGKASGDIGAVIVDGPPPNILPKP